MTRPASTVIAGCLAVLVVLVGYEIYRQNQKTAGIEVQLGDQKLSIEAK